MPNELTDPNDTRGNAIEAKINREVADGLKLGSGSLVFQNAGEAMEFAKLMAVSAQAVPKHCRGQVGICLGLVIDSVAFGVSPYALARKSYVVSDNLAYEAQAIAGLINMKAPLVERPNVKYEGEGANRRCIVTMTFRGNPAYEREYVSPLLSAINPKNSPLWKTDPDQQQAYYSIRAAARRYCPEVLLGFYDVDEVAGFNPAPVNDGPKVVNLGDKLRAGKQGQAQIDSKTEGVSEGMEIPTGAPVSQAQQDARPSEQCVHVDGQAEWSQQEQSELQDLTESLATASTLKEVEAVQSLFGNGIQRQRFEVRDHMEGMIRDRRAILSARMAQEAGSLLAGMDVPPEAETVPVGSKRKGKG